MLRLSFAKLNLLFALILCGASLQAFSQSSTPFSLNTSPLPPTTFAVNDYAGVLDEATKQSIEKRLIEFRKNTNPKVEIGVAIIKTTSERPILEYSIAVARGWGIGDKGATNSSALLLVAIDDRKYQTLVSGGLQDELPDGQVGSLQRQYLVPAFKQGNYGKGISDTIDAYIRTINEKRSGEPQATPEAINQTDKSGVSGGICGIVICLIIIFIILLIIFSRKTPPRGGGGNDRWRGGGFGGGTSSALPWIIGGLASGGDSRSSSDWGGSSGGGGDSWGGFGGGGGGFDGGGAGGDW